MSSRRSLGLTALRTPSAAMVPAEPPTTSRVPISLHRPRDIRRQRLRLVYQRSILPKDPQVRECVDDATQTGETAQTERRQANASLPLKLPSDEADRFSGDVGIGQVAR